MSSDAMLAPVQRYFADKLAAHGDTARGVDWNSPEAQRLRFEQLEKIICGSGPFSIIDWGCGYGALADYLCERGYTFTYQGLDIAPAMVARARARVGDRAGYRFTDSEAELEEADYVVASGTFNMKLAATSASWTSFVLDQVQHMNALGRRGFASNFLTKYSDADKMRDDLYYADPCMLFDHCKRNFARNVALLHDYGTWDFTLLVRKAL